MVLAAIFSVNDPDGFAALVIQTEQVCSLADRYVLILQHEFDQNRPLLISDSAVLSIVAKYNFNILKSS